MCTHKPFFLQSRQEETCFQIDCCICEESRDQIKFCESFLQFCLESLSPHLLSKHTCMTTEIFKTVSLPVVLSWRETWSLTLRKEHRLKVFEARVLKRIWGGCLLNPYKYHSKLNF
jgi:hypothetical protein